MRSICVDGTFGGRGCVCSNSKCVLCGVNFQSNGCCIVLDDSLSIKVSNVHA